MKKKIRVPRIEIAVSEIAIRDVFAMVALIGEMQHENNTLKAGSGCRGYDTIAEACYFQADEMCAFRDGKTITADDDK